MLRRNLWFHRAVVIFLGLAWWGGSAGAEEPTAQEKKLLADADRIAGVVAKLRGLALRQPIRRGVVGKSQLEERLKNRIAKDYTPAQIRAEELALKRLGLIPPGSDYMQTLLGLLTAQIAGFYDPFERQLFLAAGAAGGDFVMAHEIGHALVDQHFDLKKFLVEVKTDGDQLLARQALVEGDGLAVSLEYTMAQVGQQVPWGQEGFAGKVAASMTEAMAELREVPLVLRETLTFPYSAGTAFVAHFRKHHSWSRIDQIYKQPPLTTEHVLHPKKYIDYEKPDLVKPAPLKGLSGHTLVLDTTFGELMHSLLLREHESTANQARLAAGGWGGDRLLIYTPAGSATTRSHKDGLDGVVGILFSSWDTEADALEWQAALEKALPHLGGGALVKRAGERVVLLIGAAPETAPALLDEILKTFIVKS